MTYTLPSFKAGADTWTCAYCGQEREFAARRALILAGKADVYGAARCTVCGEYTKGVRLHCAAAVAAHRAENEAF